MLEEHDSIWFQIIYLFVLNGILIFYIQFLTFRKKNNCATFRDIGSKIYISKCLKLHERRPVLWEFLALFGLQSLRLHATCGRYIS